MKSPAFSFYPNDYLGSARVAEMTLEEEGAYLRALLYCWNNGDLPADVERLARIIGKGCSTSVATVVQRMFERSLNDDTRLVHTRLESERKKQEERRSQQTQAGRKSAETRRKMNERSTSVPTVVPTVVDISLQRESNFSSSSSITDTNTLSLPPARAHTHEAPEVQVVPRMHPAPAPAAEQVALPVSAGYEIPTLEKVIEYANMKGFMSDVAEFYFNMRQADEWKKSTQSGGVRPIADWRADFNNKARDLQQQLISSGRPRIVQTGRAPSFEGGAGPNLTAIADQTKRLFTQKQEVAS